MRIKPVLILWLAAIVLPAIACRLPAAEPDLDGILRKPIPDKLVVLTFDDGCASGYTVIAPILKSMGFNGSFYVCDFDSFKTRKDWYLTWRQMKAMAADGFEIGNHTVGHGGGLENFLGMEDELLANGVPKPSTVCWPVYAVAWSICPDLAKHGYFFGRGGHDRPYRPAVDNPFDVPSFSMNNGVTIEAFTKLVRRATGGKIVVLCYHGVPDMEHPGVSVKPEVFKVMMQYLKDNHYKAIAMRDLVEYIDPAKAGKLPRTADTSNESEPTVLATEDTPPIAMTITKPLVNLAAVSKSPLSQAKDMLTFDLPGQVSTAIAGTNIGVYVPTAMDVTKLEPTFTLSPLAQAVPVSGTALDFTTPQTYTITAQDGSSQVFTVTVAKSGEPTASAWIGSIAGNWSDASKWSGGVAPVGKADYALSFDKIAKCSITNDLKANFPLCRLTLGEGGETLILTGSSIAFAKNSVSGFLPVMTVGKDRRRVTFDLPIHLASDLHVQTVNSSDPNSLTTFKGVVSGTGGLILHSYGEPNSARINSHDVHFGILQLENSNTYSGGTIVNGGKVLVMKNHGLGMGPVMLNQFATLGAHGRIANPVIINQGRLTESTCEGPITLNSVADFYGDCDIHGEMSGPGGFTMLGKMGAYLSIIPGGTVTLHGKCTYTGLTTVFPGTLLIKKAAGLYGADTSKWTPKNIVVHQTATLRLNAGGKDEFTGEQIGVLLKNLTTANENNGLMGGAWFCIDTANTTDPVVLSANLTDSAGVGGGPITFKKCGPGTLQFTGANSYSGRTYFEAGTLSVVSLNSIEGRKASSSLGAPTTLEDGTIDLSGDCTLVYIGKGEATDRILDLNGKKQTVTLDQSGSGLLRFTSPFDMSGFGFCKTIVLQGSLSSSGELSGAIADPYDRTGKATTALTKSGTGTWTLSGSNTYIGPTTVTQGTLALGTERSLGPNTPVSISAGAMVALNFKGQMVIRQLALDGKPQPAGAYSAANTPGFIKGTGAVIVAPR